jgi:hypothetical protein
VTHIRVMVNFSIIGCEKDRRMKNNNSHIIIIYYIYILIRVYPELSNPKESRAEKV